jgi:hypothetical protein
MDKPTLSAEVTPLATDGAGGTYNLTNEDLQMIDRLVEHWRSYNEKARENVLVTRHLLGRTLNEHLGPPSMRQPRGEEVVKRAAQRLGLHVSELNRMRWFAHHFSSVSDLKGRHPEVSTWTKVKELLPELDGQVQQAEQPLTMGSPPATDGAAEVHTSAQGQSVSGGTGLSRTRRRRSASKGVVERRVVSGVLRALNSLSRGLRKLRQQPCSGDRQKLIKQLQGLAGALPSCLGIRLVVEEVQQLSQSTPATE